MSEYTHLEFRADFPKFEHSDSGVSGEEVIRFILMMLGKSGIVASEPIQEDWGWCTWLSIDGFRIMLGCGDYLEYEDGWLCFVQSPSLGWRRLLNPRRAQAAVRLAAIEMHRAIAANDRCYAKKWWTDANGLGEAVAC